MSNKTVVSIALAMLVVSCGQSEQSQDQELTATTEVRGVTANEIVFGSHQ